MNYELSDIKNIRKKLGLTQSDLASQARVSQSLVAKIENGKIDPTFSNTKKLFSALDSLQKKESLRAKDFIHRSIISCQEDELIRDVIKKMKKHEISQLPVIRDESVIGAISESSIIEHLISEYKRELKVRDVMSDSPPIVSLNTQESVISNLLKFFSLVVVQDKGKIKGVITRSDILRKIYN